MSRQRTEINPERAERIKQLIKREKITQSILAERIYQTQQNVSRIIQKKQPLTEETAKLIVAAFPEYRLSWLMGYDDIMTVDDYRLRFLKQIDDVNKAAMTLIDAAVKEVCAREGIETLPTIDNPVEYLVLEAQLRDYADSVVWNFLKHRKYSHVWQILDHDPNNPE